MKKLVLIALVLFVQINYACLNEHYSVDRYGEFHVTEEYRKPFYTDFNYKQVEKKLIELHKKLVDEKKFEVLTDYAVYLLKGKKTEEALIILQTLAFHYPSDYSISANLGTAYELSGMPDSALKYIERGMELNPNSHGGSEWIHVKILETKIKQRTEPDYLTRYTVLELTEEQEKDWKICQDILIQLRERFPFCPGPDSIMASIVTDLGDCYANVLSVEVAKGVYMIAKNYFSDESEELQHKIDEMKSLGTKYQTRTRTIVDGDAIKESHFTDKKLMENPNDPPYEIKWEKINTNPDSLLSFVGLTPIVFEPVIMEEPVDTADANILQTTEQPTEQNSNALIYFVVGLVLIITLIGVYFLKRKK